MLLAEFQIIMAAREDRNPNLKKKKDNVQVNPPSNGENEEKVPRRSPFAADEAWWAAAPGSSSRSVEVRGFFRIAR
jgi:hypothetical protein